MSDPYAPSAPAAARPPRILVVDWLRGLAVVLMIQAHGFDAWLRPEVKTGVAYDLIRHLSGLPSRLFMLLVGVSAAIKFEGQIRRGLSPGAIRADTAKRGLQVIALAYLFRLQEWTLSGFWDGVETLFRVDILNCIGASLLLLAAFGVPGVRPPARPDRPPQARPRVLLALLAGAFFLGLGPIVGPAHFPTWLPRPLTSYLGGQRPMAWFSIFPWGAYAFLGLLLGHAWLRYGRNARGQAAIFLATGLFGLATTGTVILIRELDPQIIRYPSELVQQMGPGSFFYRVGICAALAGLGWIVTRLSDDRFSPLRQLGQHSLFIYWVHIEFCYGHIAAPLKRQLGIPAAAVWVAVLTVAMFGLSLAKSRYGDDVVRWIGARVQALWPRRQRAVPPA